MLANFLRLRVGQPRRQIQSFRVRGRSERHVPRSLLSIRRALFRTPILMVLCKNFLNVVFTFPADNDRSGGKLWLA
jgi:hypothetical protein